MWRFLLPAVLMVVVPLVLLAGAIDELPAWSAVSAMLISVRPTLPSHATLEGSTPPDAVMRKADPAAPASSEGETALRASSDTLERRAADLREEIDRSSQQLTSLQVTIDQERAGLAALRERRRSEEVPPARPPGGQEQMTASPPSLTPPMQSKASRQAAPMRAPSPTTTSSILPLSRLVTARRALISGQPNEARQLMAAAEIQMVFQPVTPDQKNVRDLSAPASQLGLAIRLLDAGDAGQALRTLNAVIESPDLSHVQAAPNG